MNSHLLKGVATMAELTKTDTRQLLGKIKPTDKMVMMPGLFDGTKPETSKQHYERFNMYIKFQTKSSHLTDPVGEAIDLFKHTMPLVTTGATVLGLYSHIAHSVDKDEEEIPPSFKGEQLKQTRGRDKPKGKPQGHRQNPPKDQEADEAYTYDNPNNYYHNDNYTAPVQN